MKKILSILLVVAMVFAIVACGNTSDDPTTTPTQTTQGNTTGGTQGTTQNTQGTTQNTQGTTTTTTTIVNPGFDETDIVLSFGAISDIHLEKNSSYNTEAKFAAALNTLAAFTDERSGILDAVVIVGDIAEKKDQITTFKTIYEQVNLSGELFFTLGNHDQEAKYSNEALTLQDYKDILGDKYFANEYNDFSTGNRHMVINDKHHFIAVQPESYVNASGQNEVSFSDATVQWLDAKLKEITTADPDAYVFVFVHAMIEDTCYGSTLKYPDTGDTSYWYTSDLTSTLERYNQVITFSGHLHFPVNDERSIMQDKFTAIGTGSVAYLAIENGYSNTASATVPQNAGDVSVGHLVEVDSYGNVRITRIDFMAGTEMAEAWVLDAPTADGAHLAKYGKNRADKNGAPTMAGAEAEVVVTPVGATVVASLTFTAGSDDNFVHHYEIKITEKGTGAVIKDVKWLTDFYLYNDLANMAQNYAISLGSVKAGAEYTVEITAVDSWDAKSEPLTITVKVAEDAGQSPVLPTPYADIDFANGTIVDTKGNMDIVQNGGTVVSTSLTFNGVTKNIDAFNITEKGQYATAAFKAYSAENIDSLYNGAKGFSIEAFYVNRAKAGTQGVFCATEYGGLGLAETGGGKPGLCTYTTEKKSYKYTNGAAASSTTELVHVISTAIVYDGNLYTAIYVNGQMTASNEFIGKIFLPTTDQRYIPYANTLTIGDDSGQARFPMSNFSVVDVKFYNEALNAKQVETAYNNACALFAN